MSYAKSDADRVRPLVDYLSDLELSVWWDDDIEPGVRFRDAVYEMLEKASCVIVVWTHSSVTRDCVRSEADRALQRGVLLPVLLDSEAKIPLPSGELHCLDLSESSGRRAKALDRLVSRVRRLARRKTYGYGGALVGNEWTLKASREATAELAALVSRIDSTGEVLASDAQPAEDVTVALSEVEKTY